MLVVLEVYQSHFRLGVWSGKCEVWSVKFEVLSWSAKWNVESVGVECQLWDGDRVLNIDKARYLLCLFLGAFQHMHSGSWLLSDFSRFGRASSIELPSAKWLEVAGSGWKWLEVAGSGWKWLEVAACPSSAYACSHPTEQYF
eukprot:s871_g2.t1